MLIRTDPLYHFYRPENCGVCGTHGVLNETMQRWNFPAIEIINPLVGHTGQRNDLYSAHMWALLMRDNW